MVKGLRTILPNLMKLTNVKYSTIVRRKYPLSSPSLVWAEGMIPELDIQKHIYEEVKLDKEPSNMIDVLLSADVPGLGAAGTIVQVHRNRFWRYLYLAGLAELPSDARIEYIRSKIQGPAQVLCGESYTLQQHLSNMTLYIPMNPSTEWTLKPTHVKVAFRRYGIVMDESSITMPSQQISRKNYAIPFAVKVSKFNSLVRFYSTARSKLSDVFLIRRADTSLTDFKIAPLNLGNKAALAHFDHYYVLTYGISAWSSMRAALLTPPKQAMLVNRFFPDMESILSDTNTRSSPTMNFVQILKKHQKRIGVHNRSSQPEAISEEVNAQHWNPSTKQQYTGRSSSINTEFVNLNEFVPVTELIGENTFYSRDSDKDFVFCSDELDDVQSGSTGRLIKTIKEPICLPDLLPVRCSNPCRIEGLRDPKLMDGQLEFYPIDLGATLPILALGLEKGDKLIDLCAFSGIKSLLALQTELLSHLITVPVNPNRISFIEQTLNAFGSDFSNLPNDTAKHEVIHPELVTSYVSASEHQFNKILVDVPCSADRFALTTPGLSLFSRGNKNSRISLPMRQMDLLSRAVRLLRPGGCLVYSTCTLSPTQNQDIIANFVSSFSKKNTQIEIGLCDLSPFVDLFQSARYDLGMTVVPVNLLQESSSSIQPKGLLVIPSISANYGPTFVAKIKRLT